MKINPTYFWYAVSFLLLVHLQLNLHEFAFFAGGSILIGLFPIKKMRWWKYALLELAALGFCLLLNQPEPATLQMLSQLGGMSAPLLVLVTLLFSTLTFTLVASTTYLSITKTAFKSYLRKK